MKIQDLFEKYHKLEKDMEDPAYRQSMIAQGYYPSVKEKIIQEAEALVRKETMKESLEEIGSWDYDTVVNSTPYQLYENWVLSKGITL